MLCLKTTGWRDFVIPITMQSFQRAKPVSVSQFKHDWEALDKTAGDIFLPPLSPVSVNADRCCSNWEEVKRKAGKREPQGEALRAGERRD